VESLSSTVRQLELERNEVQSQLHESQALKQALHDKLENIQHDLASQGLQLRLVCVALECNHNVLLNGQLFKCYNVKKIHCKSTV